MVFLNTLNTKTPNTKLKQLTNAKKSAILKDSNIAFKKWGAPPVGAALFLSICKHSHRKGVVTDACQWKRNPAERTHFPASVFAGTALRPRTIAVERNEEIVPKATYAEVMLQDCDVLEVVHFMGGGQSSKTK